MRLVTIWVKSIPTCKRETVQLFQFPELKKLNHTLIYLICRSSSPISSVLESFSKCFDPDLMFSSIYYLLCILTIYPGAHCKDLKMGTSFIEWEERSLVVVISISVLYNVNVHKMFTGKWLLVSRINWHSTLSATGTSSDFKANAWILEDTVHSHQCTVDMVEVQLLVFQERILIENTHEILLSSYLHETHWKLLCCPKTLLTPMFPCCCCCWSCCCEFWGLTPPRLTIPCGAWNICYNEENISK